ncbi:catalytic protein [Aspergillus niger ATCC 1015]|uniref:Contig An14c0060, genomic contig n=5 Tax=Aspergillus niger TaxID=5061 RepID=A2R2M3_ASPNC|nr:uncharacterized protein An14g01253 [Aspergillus niger]XP_025451823.1 catalytic protein [Aspergillus niger CBS 101883]EHA27624.1 catalytic protein [Aspergillus niger ATCC 1015]RDH25976.1 catalytic protein [Aspergillus niger ATCC 13496]PYH53768.1 catalytic protein [Aspergillus niger CBS 101883]TPR07170.1 Acetyltransferase (GNAT) family protein [Aspergillus niger]CAK41906.1 unnamed protein product [Aspergillus niger]|eukprot:XP_001400753.1 hypothetical protein ANI_1_1118124 [Aspergillus niger CBS 513.88]
MTRNLAKVRFLLTLVLCVLPRAAIRISAAIFRAFWKGLPLGSSMWNGFAGALITNTPPDQLQAVLPSTLKTYESWVLSRGVSRAVDVLAADNSTRLLWIGPSISAKVLLFFHGGGYVLPLSEAHLDWMAYLRNEAANAGVDMSVCILEYDLIPTNPYPRQLKQAIFAIQRLLVSGYRPSDIVFGGDSAGGHLSLSLMAHLHRHYQSNEVKKNLIHLQSPVKGCFLVSPLSSFDFSTPSYQRWFSADILTRKVVDEWGRYLVNNSPWHEEISAGYGWGMALDVPDSWWDGFTAVDSILVTGGYEEVFSDHIQLLGETLKTKCKGNVALHMSNETHDGPLMDFEARRPPSETTRAIRDFIIACFKD